MLSNFEKEYRQRRYSQRLSLDMSKAKQFTDLDKTCKKLEPEKIIGGVCRGNALWLLIKWKNREEHDLLPSDYVQKKYPQMSQEIKDTFHLFVLSYS